MNLMLHTAPAWLGLMSLSLCVGALLAFLRVLPPDSEGPGRDRLNTRLWTVFDAAVVVLAATSAAEFLVRTAEMSGRHLWTAYPLLLAVLRQTHFGRVWALRMAVIVVIAFTRLLGWRRRYGPASLAWMLLLLALIAATQCATGHAADAGDFTAAELADFLHLAGALAWGGGLFVFSVAILPELMKTDDPDARLLAGAAERFSQLAGIAVGVIVLSALYNTWAFIGSAKAFLDTPYGRIVSAKIVLFAALVCLGFINRFLSVPRLEAWSGIREYPRGAIDRLVRRIISSFMPALIERPALRSFARIVAIESCVMAGMLLCAAFLRHEVPALHFAHQGHGRQEHDRAMHHDESAGAAIMRIETAPQKIVAGKPVELMVYLEDGHGKPVQGLMVHHERILHAVIIGEDLTSFGHIHPEDLGAVSAGMLKMSAFPLRFTFPRAGTYLVGADFMAHDGEHSETALLTVSGRPPMAAPTLDLTREKNFGPYRVTLLSLPQDIKAGTETDLRFLVRRGSKPVNDLEPYLGAAMHLAVVRSDLTRFMHVHGTAAGLGTGTDHGDMRPPARFGPEIDATVVFPEKGLYKIFSQVKRGNDVLLFDFLVQVR